MNQTTPLRCACGETQLEALGAPIITTECHCNSCRTAGERMGALPGAPRVLEANGGTACVLYRKDRVRFPLGSERLKAFRLTAETPTRRVIATCCNTPMFLEFQNGHWLSLYSNLWPEGGAPRVEERTMTIDRTAATPLPEDVPNSKRQSLSFFVRLLGAWIAMGFRRPKVIVAGGDLEV